MNHITLMYSCNRHVLVILQVCVSTVVGKNVSSITNLQLIDGNVYWPLVGGDGIHRSMIYIL